MSYVPDVEPMPKLSRKNIHTFNIWAQHDEEFKIYEVSGGETKLSEFSSFKNSENAGVKTCLWDPLLEL